jgi:hypothetical protein
MQTVRPVDGTVGLASMGTLVANVQSAKLTSFALALLRRERPADAIAPSTRLPATPGAHPALGAAAK